MVSPPLPPLDALDQFLYQVDARSSLRRQFYAASTPEEMVALADRSGILIDEDEFRARLRSGSGIYWVLGGDGQQNPIAHLLEIFSP